jgi:outer membrane protein assembly factor BamB
MVEPVVIELGELRDQPEPERGPRGHRAVALLVALAFAAGLGGSVPAGDPLVEARVPMALGESMEVVGDRLYVVSPHRNQPAPGGRRITAYRLPDGRRLWETRVEEYGGEFGTVTTMGETLLLATYDQDGAGDVIGLDAGTGARRWRRPGWVLSWPGFDRTADRVLLGSAAGAPGPWGRLEQVTAVDLVTGEPAWTYRPPPGAIVQTSSNDSGGGAGYLATGLRSGRVEIRDPSTGVLLAATDAGPPLEPVVPDQIPDRLYLLDDLLMILEPARGTLTAYGVPALDRRWSATVDRGRTGWYRGPACGDLVCLQSSDGQVRAVDLDTGRTRWTAGWSYLEQVGTSLLASRADGPLGGETPLALVDPDTGRRQAELGSWAITGRRSGGDVILVSQDLATQRTWFGVVDPARRDVRLMGVAHGVVGECWAGVDCLVCRRRDLSIGIWRYR